MRTNGAGTRQQEDRDAPEQRPGGEQALADSEQTLSESDQTLSERDQTLSDRDQQASDDDQAASDSGAHGVDPAPRARSAARRAETARERLPVASLRGETARQRDRAAQQRDELAARRDRVADRLDEEALELESHDALLDQQTLRVQEVRARAAAGRMRAAYSRERAAHDRKLAARDRELAASDREQSRRELEQAGTDELTGARRRGVGLEELKREIDRARRTGENLVAAFIDADGLKRVNDHYGHTAGDELLRDVAEALRGQMRSYDLLVRLGGDEFLCVLPGVTLDAAQRRFGDLNAKLPEGPTVRSVSVGLTELQDGDEPQQLIDRADRKLLAARSG